MWLVRALCIAVVALGALPMAAFGDLGEGVADQPAAGLSDGSPGPSLAALRAHSAHRRVGGAPVYPLANGCYTLSSKLLGTLIVKQDDGSYRAVGTPASNPERFRMQATALGSYLFYGTARDFLASDTLGAVKAAGAPSDKADWEISRREALGYKIYSRAADKVLAVSRTDAKLVLVDKHNATEASRFNFVRSEDCPRYPEATVNTTGKPFRGTGPDGQVVGFVEAHQHLMFFEAFGGKFHCGRPWHRFGVEYALPDCADIEGPEGSAAPVQNFLNSGSPVDPHDTKGWPTFVDWPTARKLTYEQVYYKWLERAWRGGLRIFVALNTDNKALCDAYTATPRLGQRTDCNEMNSVRRQIADVYELRDYIDAQNGGPGRGWFRIVKSPAQARNVIEDGKLAVVLGVETSKPLDCGVFNEEPECTKAEIDVELQKIHDMGVRQMELINKFDNAFGGVAGDSGSTGVVVNSGNFKETARYWDMQSCDTEAEDQPQMTSPPHTDIGAAFQAFPPMGGLAPVYTDPPPHCNQLGLSSLGEHMVKRMMGRGMIVDPDHLGVIARRRALDVIEDKRYPGVISSHTWSDVDAYPKIHQLGGLVTPYAGDSTSFKDAWEYNRNLRKRGRPYGIGYGSDMHGLGQQGGPRNGENPVQYPFTSADGTVTLDRPQAGERTFDINTDGVAQYGLYPDWIEDLRMIAGEQIVKDMSRGAESYLRMWERATTRSQELHSLGR